MHDFQGKYANYWSDVESWGGEYLPKEGDSIVILKGQTLIIDIDESPILNAIIVYGALVFLPDTNPSFVRTFDARHYLYTKVLFLKLVLKIIDTHHISQSLCMILRKIHRFQIMVIKIFF